MQNKKTFIQMYEEKYIRFPDGKEKALALSYDDGVKADKKLVKKLNEHRLSGTFNLNSELFGCKDWHDRLTEEEAYELFGGGAHEVAIHGARHIFLDKVPLPEAAFEVVKCRNFLENKFQRIVSGMAYSYNGYNDDICNMLKSLGVKYARTTNPTYSFAIPKDFLRLDPTCHHKDERFLKLCDRFFDSSPTDEKKSREGWLFLVWGHSYEFDEDDNWQIIENLFKRAENCKSLWSATLSEVVNYIEAYNKLEFSLDGERVFNPSFTPVWLEIRGKVYKIDSGKTIVF